MKKRAALIHTGGTFVMEKNLTGRLTPGHSAVSSIKNHLLPRYPDILVDQIELFNIDSSLFTPDYWILLADKIDELYRMYDGFIIIHGTDTLAYTAAALSFMLINLDKPVVITGSQLPLLERRSDAFLNLSSALEVIGDGALKEVSVAFNNKVYRGNRIKKRDVWDFHAFFSPNYPVLIKLGIGLDKKESLFLIPGASVFKTDTRICRDVLLISFYPGLDFSFYITLVKNSKVKGIVIEAYGSGNIPSDNRTLDNLFSEAAKHGIVVVVCSQSPVGKVNLELYEAAEKAGRYGLISGGDMTKEAALVKLMVALGRFQTREEVKDFMLHNIAGEKDKQG